MAEQMASDAYDIEVVAGLPRWKRWLRAIMTFGGGAIAMGEGVSGAPPTNPGGRHVSVSDKATGERLITMVEDWGDDLNDLVGGVTEDHASMTADDFAAKWLPDSVDVEDAAADRASDRP